MPDGSKPLKLRLFARQNSAVLVSRRSQFIQGWFKELGITVDIKVISEDALTERIGQGSFDMFHWGWVVEPDPDYQLSTFTCGKRSYKDGGQIYADLSDSFYCNKAYDTLYAEQAGQIDPAQRAETVKQMQQILYDDAPYVMLYYYDDLQAYSDRFTGFVPQPPTGRRAAVPVRHLHLPLPRPWRRAPRPDPVAASAPPRWWRSGAGAAVIVALGGLLLARRRRAGGGMDVE